MEIAIVILIVAGAAIYVARIFYKGFKQKEGCACGCTCCDISDSGCRPPAGDAHDVAPFEADRRAG